MYIHIKIFITEGHFEWNERINLLKNISVQIFLHFNVKNLKNILLFVEYDLILPGTSARIEAIFSPLKIIKIEELFEGGVNLRFVNTKCSFEDGLLKRFKESY